MHFSLFHDKTYRKIATLLWYALCISLTADTGLFVYLSLSQTLVGGVFILLLGFCTAIINFRAKVSMLRSRIQILVLFWMLYIVFHAAFYKTFEIYKLIYLEETLFLVLTLPVLIANDILTRRKIENGILLMVIIHVTGLLFQYMGILDSYSNQFVMTGFSDNPNVVAILIALSIPLIYKRCKDHSLQIFWICFFIVSILVFILLKCRTAYVGLASILVVRIVMKEKTRSLWYKQKKYSKVAFIVLVSILTVICGVALYKYKQASADGRVLVWKVSSMMIQEHPMGCGIGMFEHDYNIRQGEYFAAGTPTETEKFNSGTVFMAYNDFIEHTVEAGILGLFFILSMYIGLFFRAYTSTEKESFSIIAAFFIMSFVNFIYSSIQPWVVMLAYASIVLSSKDILINRQYRGNKFICKGVFLTCSVLLYFHIPLICSQLQLEQYQKRTSQKDGIDIFKAELLSEHIGTSEAYFCFMNKQYTQLGMHEKALQCITNAMEYTSDPSVYFSAFDCYVRMGKTREGIPYIKAISKMLPQNLTSRLVLLKWYDQEQKYKEAFSMAEEIANMNLKVENARSNSIKLYAIEYLHHHNK